ncbi:MAG: hypothetical protein FWF28_03180, partial [Micrococcales bacterium]|nr:hypothetical protein [Micrococcales bacterium]
MSILRSWGRLGVSRGFFVAGGGTVAAALVAGLVPGLAGGTALAAGEVSAPATWQAGDLAVAAVQSSGDHPLGTAGPAQYAYGITYDGALDGASGVLITGQEQPNSTITLLAGDTLTGSAVVWSDAGGTGGAGISGVTGQSPSANLGGELTGISSQDPTTGAQQVRWSLTDATADAVNASPTTPGELQAGYADGTGPTGQVSVFVASPTLDASLEVCTTGTDCDPAAAAGTGGWATSATLPEGTADVAWRISATNTGNVDLTDVRVATATAGSGDLSACLGASIGDLPVGLSSTVTCTTPTADISTASVSVSGVFAGQGPDGQPLVNRFTDAAGTTGRVPSPAATATLITAGSPAPSASTTASLAPAPGATPTASPLPNAGVSAAPMAGELAAADDPMNTQTLAVNMYLITTPTTQLSGSQFAYQVGVSCGAVSGDDCTGVTVSIPIPDDSGIPGSTSPATWLTSVAGLDTTLIPLTAQVSDDGKSWVITFLRSMSPG